VKVADLQQHLADLARLLEASGAKAVAGDLAAIGKGLAPFRELPLKSFAAFLTKAEAYSGGEVPLARPAGQRSAAKRAAKAPGPGAEAMANEARELYERAADPAVTLEEIDRLASRLGSLSKDGLAAVAEGIGLKGIRAKTKGFIQEAIRSRITARKGTAQRVGLLDRPGEEQPSQAKPALGGGTRRPYE
jgi:hypothetical protein